MKTSARNTFFGSVTQITKGAVNAEVQINTKQGEKLVAIITNESVDSLALKEGKEVYALVKANWIILGKDLHKSGISTRNLLCGTIDSVQDGAVNAEVHVKLQGGEILTSVITEGSLGSLGLKAGDHICAAFKASSVILAVD